MKEIKLKPCPFCGATDGDWVTLVRTVGEDVFFVECRRCAASGPWYTEKAGKKAVAAWNRRAKGEA